jgi:hypothetical protein
VLNFSSASHRAYNDTLWEPFFFFFLPLLFLFLLLLFFLLHLATIMTWHNLPLLSFFCLFLFLQYSFL